MATSQPQPQNTATITLYLDALRRDDPVAAAQAIELLYPELHRIAGQYMSRERKGQTLPPRLLLHAAYLQLFGKRDRNWSTRIHFIGAAARTMRQILTEYARARLSRKRAAGVTPEMVDDFAFATQRPEQYVAIEEALTRLSARDPELAKIVEMRCFGGLAEEEIALALGASPSDVRQRWKDAKQWLESNCAG